MIHWGNKIGALFGLLLLISLSSCGGHHKAFENAATKNMTRTEQQKFAKYMIRGKELYKQYCTNCHQDDGKGLGRLYPPLANSDFIKANEGRVVCIIKNGLKGEIVVNDTTYNQQMPAQSHLSNLEVAMLSTYLFNSWGEERGFITVDQTAAALKNCE